MTLHQFKYLTIEKKDVLGEYETHYSYRRDVNVMLKPVFKVEQAADNSNEFLLIPGYLNDDTFYPCPLQIVRIVLHKIVEQLRTENDTLISSVEAHIDVYNKDLSKHISHTIVLGSSGSSVVYFGYFDRIFNLINLYIEAGNAVEDLNFDAFSRGGPYEDDKRTLLNIINSLKFEFYENSRYAAGKDNYFWEEAEIRGIPDDPYLQKLILECLRKCYGSFQVKDDHVLVMFNHDRGYSPYYDRRKQSGVVTEEGAIKDNLKFELATVYDSRAHLFSKLKKRTPANANNS